MSAFSLSGMELFRGVGEDDLTPFEAGCSWQRWQCDDVVSIAGGAVPQAFFVVEGRVRTAVPGATADEVVMMDFCPGQCFGLTTVFDPKAPPSSAIAMEDSLVAVMSGTMLQNAVFQFRTIALNLINGMSAGLSTAILGSVSDRSLSDRQRVLGELIRLSEPAGGAGINVITQLPSHGDIAHRCGASEEMVSDTLADLIKQGIARRRHPSLFLMNMSQLQAQAGFSPSE